MALRCIRRAAAAAAWFCLVVHGFDLRAANNYTLGTDSMPREGVPAGELIDGTYISTNSLFPGTTRAYTVYLPRQLDRQSPAPLLVVQDGRGMANGWKVPVVLDNLIHSKELPPIVGVFVSPGVVPAPNTNALPRYNRSFEYDSMGDRYARFLIEEFLPWIERTHGVTFSKDPSARAIAGASSGAIAAFTAAWERPDSFSRVFSTIGTYVGLRGGNDYPVLVRKTEPKPLRIFLQDGSSDLNIYGGNWWMANLDMLSALEFAGYEVNHAWGDGGHDSKHGASVFPDAMRWLWKDYPKPVPKSTASRNPFLSGILVPGADWVLVSEGHRFTEGPAVNARGEVFFTDIPNNRIHKIGLDGSVTVFAEDTGAANGLMFHPDGHLYAAANSKRQIVRYDTEGKAEVVIGETPVNDLVTTFRDGFYSTDPENKKVWYTSPAGERKLVDTGLGFANGIVLSPDQTLLYVADTRSQWVWSYAVQPDFSLAQKQPYFHLHVPDPAIDSGADGMTVDVEGRLYVTTRLGLQVCDQAGRVNAILPKPGSGWLSNACFGGPELDTLYVTCGERVFRRKTRTRGVVPWRDPILPPRPRL
ncbi:MAG: SMP-30/gluconolactonase/LRE family protein [Limisphaerales bacterium]